MNAKGLHRATHVLLLCVWVAAPAAADPIRVTGGFLDIVRPDGQMHLSGERGFALDARVSTMFGVWMPEILGCFQPACGAGPLSLFAHWSGTDIHGTASLEGDTQALRMDGPSAYVEFFSGVELPEPNAQPVTLAAPFTFTGLLFTGMRGEHRNELVGDGLATIMLSPQTWDGSLLWTIQHARYEFHPNPVPEPSTLVLLSGAAATLARTQWRSRRRRRS